MDKQERCPICQRVKVQSCDCELKKANERAEKIEVLFNKEFDPVTSKEKYNATNFQRGINWIIERTLETLGENPPRMTKPEEKEPKEEGEKLLPLHEAPDVAVDEEGVVPPDFCPKCKTKMERKHDLMKAWSECPKCNPPKEPKEPVEGENICDGCGKSIQPPCLKKVGNEKLCTFCRAPEPDDKDKEQKS